MSLTFLAKSWAYSWKMSFAGQVDWKRRLTVCAVEIIGAARAPAPTVVAAARLMKRRRAVGFWVMGLSPFGCV